MAFFDGIELDRNQLAKLASTGVWEEINEHCGTWIDIYEEVEIKTDQLGNLLACIERARSSACKADSEVRSLLQRFSILAQGAQARGVSVWTLF